MKLSDSERHARNAASAGESGLRCFVFRAANWSVNPGRNVVQALLNNEIKVDTSIFNMAGARAL